MLPCSGPGVLESKCFPQSPGDWYPWETKHFLFNKFWCVNGFRWADRLWGSQRRSLLDMVTGNSSKAKANTCIDYCFYINASSSFGFTKRAKKKKKNLACRNASPSGRLKQFLLGLRNILIELFFRLWEIQIQSEWHWNMNTTSLKRITEIYGI